MSGDDGFHFVKSGRKMDLAVGVVHGISEVAEEHFFGARRSIERDEGDFSPAFHAGERHVLLHLVHETLAVEQGALDVGKRMLRIGEVPGVIVPCLDEFLGLETIVRALRIEKPNSALTTDAVADNSDEWFLGERYANCRQCGGEAWLRGQSQITDIDDDFRDW